MSVEVVGIFPSLNCPKLTFDQMVGIWSLDRMAVDRNKRSKFFVKFGTRSNVVFGTRSKVFINFGTRSKVF
jgi:hypothetical protein